MPLSNPSATHGGCVGASVWAPELAGGLRRQKYFVVPSAACSPQVIYKHSRATCKQRHGHAVSAHVRINLLRQAAMGAAARETILLWAADPQGSRAVVNNW